VSRRRRSPPFEVNEDLIIVREDPGGDEQPTQVGRGLTGAARVEGGMGEFKLAGGDFS
jgi:hypothetical protein